MSNELQQKVTEALNQALPMNFSLFKMVRSGQFTAAGPTANQCAAEGQALYFYEVKLAFGGAEALDENGFLTDATQIDTFIQGLPLSGSCEQMHLQLEAAFTEFLGPKLLAYKMSIKPCADAKGFIDYAFARNISLINCF